MSDFWEVYEIIKDEFYTTGKIEKQKLVDGAISWMVDSLGDMHSEYMDPEITEKFNASLNWDFEWIGAVVEKVPMWVLVERIINWSPAKKYGVRSWDIIISANGTELEKLDIYDAIEEIKWPAGTTVLLEILRADEDSILKIEVTRAKIQIPSVEEKYFEEENIGYIALNMFWESTASEFKTALENIKNSEVDGLIIDMRDNGGGYLQSAVEILSEFVEEGKVLVKTKYRDSFFNENYYSFNNWEIFDKKIVILINGNSASASEITAWALSDYDKAILVWEQSYGKWSVQQPFEMKDGSLLKLTVARWYTPDGISIEESGITPDIEVEFLPEDYENRYDRQLEEAKKVLDLYREKGTIGLTIEAYNVTLPAQDVTDQNSQSNSGSSLEQ